MDTPVSACGFRAPLTEGPMLRSHNSGRATSMTRPSSTHHDATTRPARRNGRLRAAERPGSSNPAWRGATFSLHPSCRARIRPLQGSERVVRGAGARWIVSLRIPSHRSGVPVANNFEVIA